MPLFRSRPNVVHAEQFWPGRGVTGVCLCEGAGLPHCHSTSGLQYVAPGDWVVIDLQGEAWPVKPHVFAERYEPAEGDP